MLAAAPIPVPVLTAPKLRPPEDAPVFNTNHFDPKSAEDLSACDVQFGNAMHADLMGRRQFNWDEEDVSRVLIGLDKSFVPGIGVFTARLGIRLAILKRQAHRQLTWSEVRAAAVKCALALTSIIPPRKDESGMEPITPADAFTLLRNQAASARDKRVAQADEARDKLLAQLDSAEALHRILTVEDTTKAISSKAAIPKPVASKKKRHRPSRAKKPPTPAPTP